MRVCIAVVLLWSVVQAGVSRAESSIGVGIEYFDWREDTTPEVTEKGPLLSVHASYLPDASSGLLIGAKGRAWLGAVDYEGTDLFNSAIRRTGTSDYFGVSGEGQLRWRSQGGPHYLDLILGLGVDSWVRELSSSQAEYFTMWSTRLAFELSPQSRQRGLLAGLGVRYPLYMREVADFSGLGKAKLKPKGDVSFTAHIGFALDSRWRVLGYYETLWMKQSDWVQFDFGPSRGVQLIRQPTSKMDVFGLRVEYQFGP